VFKILKNKKEFLTTQEITDLCKSQYACVIRALNSLFKFGEIERKIVSKDSGPRNTRIYAWKYIKD